MSRSRSRQPHSRCPPPKRGHAMGPQACGAIPPSSLHPEQLRREHHASHTHLTNKQNQENICVRTRLCSQAQSTSMGATSRRASSSSAALRWGGMAAVLCGAGVGFSSQLVSCSACSFARSASKPSKRRHRSCSRVRRISSAERRARAPRESARLCSCRQGRQSVRAMRPGDTRGGG